MADNLALQLIMDMEGFRSKAYWDENAWRVGYGSDTYVDANGKVRKVTKDTSGVTREQAYADLTRRVPEFQQDGIIKYVGQQAWNQMAPATQAAVTSLAYNYGSIAELPSLKRAIKTGSATRIADAIEARKGDNGGMNKKRRLEEASLVAPLQPNVPPRRPDTGAPQTALAALESGFAPPLPTASAYAPSVGSTGSLTASPAPQGRGVPIPPRTALPQAPSPRAADIPPRAALPLPAVPSQVAREPWSTLPYGVAEKRPPALPTPKLDAQTLSKYAETYVPTNQRALPSASPKPIPVKTVPIDPRTGGLAAPDLQTALNQKANGYQLKDIPPLPMPPTKATDVLSAMYEVNKGRPASSYPTAPSLQSATLQPMGSNTLQPLPTPGLQVARDETPVKVAATGKTYPFGYAPDTTRLIPKPAPLQPGMSGPMPPAPPVQTAGIAPIPMPAPTMYRPSFPLFREPLPLSEQIATDDSPGNFIPKNGTGAIIKQATGPGPQFVSEMSLGKHPIASFFAQMMANNQRTPGTRTGSLFGGNQRPGGLFGGLFNPNRPQVSTALSTNSYAVPMGTNSAQNGLSGAQIDIAQNQSKGDSAYQDLIQWAMNS